MPSYNCILFSVCTTSSLEIFLHHLIITVLEWRKTQPKETKRKKEKNIVIKMFIAFFSHILIFCLYDTFDFYQWPGITRYFATYTCWIIYGLMFKNKKNDLFLWYLFKYHIKDLNTDISYILQSSRWNIWYWKYYNNNNIECL